MNEMTSSQSSSITELPGTNNINAEKQDNNTQWIIIIVACSVSALILILITVVVIRRSSMCNPGTKVSPDNNEKPEKEVVHNSIYKSVELKADSNYENVGSSNGENSEVRIHEGQMKSARSPNTSTTGVYSQVY